MVNCFRIGFAHIGRVGSVAVTVSISIERYTICCYPNQDMPFKSLLVPIPIMFAILYNVPKFFELASCNKSNILHDDLTSNGTNKFKFPSFLKHLNTSDDTLRPYVAGLNLNVSTNFSKNTFPIHPLIQFHLDDLKFNEPSMDSCPDGYRTTWLRNNWWYIIFYVFWSKFILVEIIPWFTVIILTITTLRKMKEFQAMRNRLIGTNRTAQNQDEGNKHCSEHRYRARFQEKGFSNITIPTYFYRTLIILFLFQETLYSSN